MILTEKEWEKKWRKKLQDLPDELESIQQLNVIISATIERYEINSMIGDAICWSHVQRQMNKLYNEKAL